MICPFDGMHCTCKYPCVMKCVYPDCDGGPQTGYCHVDCSLTHTKEANVEKPVLKGLIRDDPKTPEGKYLVKRRDGTVVEWPHFVLGARDPHAPAAILAYVESAGHDPGFDKGLLRRLIELIMEFEAYRKEHGPGDPHLGIHRTDDPATVAEMKKGWSA